MKHSAFLQELCNHFGDLKICRLQRTASGECFSSKWSTILSEWGTLDFFNNRQIGKHEVVIDIDAEPRLENYKSSVDALEKRGVTYAAFSTGSKGYHIHCFSDFDFCLSVLKKYGDTQKISKKVMIACEYAPHWKTGRPKTLLRARFCGGISWDWFSSSFSFPESANFHTESPDTLLSFQEKEAEGGSDEASEVNEK